MAEYYPAQLHEDLTFNRLKYVGNFISRRMTYNLPAGKMRRRSSFFEKQLFDGTALDFTTARTENTEINKYLKKLGYEKEAWEEYESTLRANYRNLKKNHPSNDCLEINKSNSTQFSKLLEMCNKVNEDYSRLCKTSLPKLRERLILVSNECDKQVKMEKQLLVSYGQILDNLQKKFCIVCHSYFEPSAFHLHYESSSEIIGESTFY